MKLPKNMKVCVLGVCVVALGVMLGSNIVDKNKHTCRCGK